MANDDKQGRNTSCHCGSGKKFKQCCLGKEQERQASKGVALTAFVLLLGLVGALLLWNAKGSGSGLAAAAAAVIVATGVHVLRDPAPPRNNSGDASAINFGGKS